MSGVHLAAALTACCAAVAAAEATCVLGERGPNANVLTITNSDFERALATPAGDRWLCKRLRCRRVTFIAFVEFLQRRGFAFSTTTFRKHSYAKRVAGVLYFYGSSGSYQSTADAMGMNEAVLFVAVDELTAFLVSILAEVVRFPQTLDEWRSIENKFKQKKGIPGITGAVDGSLIAIQRPDDYEGFYCRKCYPAINMQAIVNADLKFMAIDLFPGSWSDKKMWKFAPSSDRYCAQMPKETHLLGDSGYTLYPWLITPYLPREEGGRLTQRQKDFNFAHSSTRMTVEQTFGRWKGRFRRLLTVMGEKTIDKVCSIIAATVVVHNLFQDLADDAPFPQATDEDVEVVATPEHFPAASLRAIALTKRDRLMSVVTR